MTLLKFTSASQAKAINKSELVLILDTWTLLLCYSCHVGKKFEIYLGKQIDGRRNSHAESEVLYQHSNKIAALKLQCPLLARSLLVQGRSPDKNGCAAFKLPPPPTPFAVLQHSTLYLEMFKTLTNKDISVVALLLSQMFFRVIPSIILRCVIPIVMVQ